MRTCTNGTLSGSYANASCAVTASASSALAPIDLSNYELTDLGKWLDAPTQGSYYAYNGSLMRDDSGRLHITYCSSGQDFNANYAPDWRSTATNAPDKIRYQYSDDNGATWSSAVPIIYASTSGGKEDVLQEPCTNSLVYLNGYYYLYFESAYDDSSSKLIGIEVARANNVAGPYQVLTENGWQQVPTTAPWKPVLKPAISLIPGGEAYAAAHLVDPQGMDNKLWGAGIPRAVAKDGKIYLYYIDSTYNYGHADNAGSFVPYHPGATLANAYQMLSVSSDPTVFANTLANKLKDTSGNDLWLQSQVKYVPESGVFTGFINEDQNGAEKLVYRTSADGLTWSPEKTAATLPAQYGSVTTGFPQDGKTYTMSDVSVLSDKYGNAKLSDLMLGFSKNYILPNAPVGWPDTPNYKWYYGGNNIYGIKLAPQSAGSALNVTASQLNMTGEDIAGTQGAGSDGIPDEHIRLTGVTSPIQSVSVYTNDALWTNPLQPKTWYVAVRPESDPTVVDLYFDLNQYKDYPSFSVALTLANGQSTTIQTTPAMPRITGTLLGLTSEDIVSTQGAGPDGVKDMHIRLSNVTQPITSAAIYTSGALWVNPWQSKAWYVGIYPSSDPHAYDLYFDLDHGQTYPSYTVVPQLSNGTRDSITVQ
jgi:hypothetical protein